MAGVGGGQLVFGVKLLGKSIHCRADSFIACACFYIAESDMEYSEAHVYWPG